MVSVTFRCKRSGNTVSFSNENDIAGLRAHEGYEEIGNGLQEEIKEEVEVVPSFLAVDTEPKKRHRRTKAQIEADNAAKLGGSEAH